MTREEKLELLKINFTNRLATLNNALKADREQIIALELKYKKQKEKVNKYYDSLAQKLDIDTIVTAGEPDITL